MFLRVNNSMMYANTIPSCWGCMESIGVKLSMDCIEDRICAEGTGDNTSGESFSSNWSYEPPPASVKYFNRDWLKSQLVFLCIDIDQ